MSEILLEIANQLQLAYASSGALGAASVALTLGLRLYRLPQLQDKLPERAKWDNLPGAAKVLIPFGLSALSSGLAAVVTGAGYPAIVTAAVAAGLGAVGLHHGTKLLGTAEGALRSSEPGALRKTLEVIVPLPNGVYKAITPKSAEVLDFLKKK
jgi:hypothetical protein